MRWPAPRRWIAAPAIWAPALLYGVLLLGLLAATPRTPLYGGYDFDGRFYAAMAGDPAQPAEFARLAPWCYRVLTPWLASLLGGAPGLASTASRFLLLDFAAWLGTALLLHRAALRAGADLRAALLAVTALLASFAGPRFAFYSPFYVEPGMMLWLAAGIVWLQQGRLAALTVWLPLGLLQRPQVALLIPCAWLDDLQRGRLTARRAAGHAALLALAAGTWWELHRRVVPVNEAPGVLDTAGAVVTLLARDPDYALGTLLSLGIGLGVLPLAVALLPGARRLLARDLWMAAYLVLGLASLLAGADKVRLVFLLSPVLALALAVGIAALELDGRRAAVLALALLAGHGITQAPWVDLSRPDAYLEAFVPLSASELRAGPIALRLLLGNALAAAGVALARVSAGPAGPSTR